MTDIIKLFVPYEDKEQIKNLGGKWDADKKYWTCRRIDEDYFTKWRDVVKLNVSYDDRHKIKKLGAFWDAENKTWVCLSEDVDNFVGYVATSSRLRATESPI